MIRRRLLPAALALLLAACADTPDYTRPTHLLPGAWPASAAAGETPAGGGAIAAQIEWRQFFLDADLRELITTALDENRDLRLAISRVAETRAQLAVINADKLPTLSAGLTQNVTLYPPWMTNTVTPVTSKRNDLTFSAVSYELDFWGRVSSLSEAGQAAYLATIEAGRALRISLIAEVANLYYTRLELRERIAIVRTAIDTRKKTRDVIQRGMDLGAAARSDVLIAESLLNNNRGELAILEGQLASTEHLLAQMIGKATLTPAAASPTASLLAQDVRNDLAPGIPSEVLLARPDVLAAEYRLKEAQANIRAARTAFLPRILLTASFGLASRSLAGLFAGDTVTWSYQPTLSLPLFDNGRNAGLLDMAVARKEQVVADYERTIQQAFREVADLLAARTALGNQMAAAEGALRANRERLIVAEARYRSGSGTYLEVLDAEREVLAGRQAVLQVRRAQLGNTAQLYKALGGGDIPPPKPAADKG